MGSNGPRGQNHKEPDLGISARVKAGALAIAISFFGIVILIAVVVYVGLKVIWEGVITFLIFIIVICLILEDSKK